jgi:hypothetical protein
MSGDRPAETLRDAVLLLAGDPGWVPGLSQLVIDEVEAEIDAPDSAEVERELRRAEDRSRARAATAAIHASSTGRFSRKSSATPRSTTPRSPPRSSAHLRRQVRLTPSKAISVFNRSAVS